MSEKSCACSRSATTYFSDKFTLKRYNKTMQLVKLKEGRPTVLTQEVVNNLIVAFQKGLNDTVACQYARISRDTFYRHYKNDEEFKDVIDQAKNLLLYIAHEIIHEVLTDPENKYSMYMRIKLSMWLLE